MNRRQLTTLALQLALAPLGLSAQTTRYPDKALRWIVPASPGSYPDLLARLVAPRLGELLGQSVVIDNQPGAGTNRGTANAAKAPADGHTLLLHSVAVAINATLYKKLEYDPVNDFAPVSQLTSVSNVVAIHPKLPVQTLGELIAYAKAHPGKVHYASAGNGTTAHLAGHMLKSLTDAPLTHVPYSNFNQAVTDVIGGQVAMMIPNLPPMLGHVKSGALRALAVTGRQRSASLPQVPTVMEAGVPGYEVSSWHGIALPARAPDTVVKQLHGALDKILKEANIQAKLADMGADIVASAPPAYAAYIRSEIDKWAKVIKDAGAQVE